MIIKQDYLQIERIESKGFLIIVTESFIMSFIYLDDTL